MKLSEKIQSVNSIVVAGHTRPDGDCVGSCMGLYNYLKENYPEKDVSVYLEDTGNAFAYINRIDEAITEDDEEKQVDLFILLDTSDIARIGVANKLFENAKNTLCIDHHVSNPGFAMENIIVAGASSASEVLYDLLDEDKISKEVAEAIKAQFDIVLDKRKITMNDVKAFGSYQADLKFTQGVTATVTVVVCE